MNRLAVAIDSNLLLLLVVGMASREYIRKHKRLQEFTADDYDLLQEQLSVATEVIVTPNTPTETSNLIDHIADPARKHIYDLLRDLLRSSSSSEVYIPSQSAAERPELPRLGLTDCALLDVCSGGTPLITVDLKLYLAAIAAGDKALNFNHLRDSRI